MIMSNKGNVLISILILALGVVFIWLYDRHELPGTIVLLCGLAFVVPAVISLLSMFIARRSDRASAGLRFVQIVCGIGGLGLGLAIILLPEVFRPLLVYPFAGLMIVGGAFQVFQISQKYRPVDYPAWMYVAPILILAAGVVLLCVSELHTPRCEQWVVLVTGIAGVLFGINGLCVSVLSRRLPPLRSGSVTAGANNPSDRESDKAEWEATQMPVGQSASEKDAPVATGDGTL